ncbi:MAG: LysM peptidoglycan-binding domain-containing protein [Planctomycetaceae bacterium]|nr:LysM peptidoglycan-binding domain-containing protein [Planctomycetaceae bacterium]
MLTAVLAVAWVMSQFSDDSRESLSAEQSSNSVFAQHPSRSTDEMKPAAEDGSNLRQMVAAEIQPLIPGLLDDSEHVFPHEQTATEANRPDPSGAAENSETGANPLPNHLAPRDLTGVPLRRVSSTAFVPRSEEPNDAATVITEDGSSPRSRPLPSFSMPNTQPRVPVPSHDESQREPANHSVVAQESQPSSTGLRPLVPDTYRVLETQLSEPKPLPGERHVLRPIIRAKAATNSPERESEFPPASDAIWDTPMPGVKRETPFPAGPSPSVPSTPMQSPTQTSAPAAGGTGSGVSSAGDPLFVQVGASNGTGSSLLRQDSPATTPQFRPESQIVSTPSTAPIRSGGRPRPQSGDYIWHVIQQNQSLESISFQYRGDGSLVAQLLELNRDRLSDPQLLPIGKAIRIPIR